MYNVGELIVQFS